MERGKDPRAKDAQMPKSARNLNTMPTEGPHAKPELTDTEKTPGAGALPDRSNAEADIGPD